MIVNYWNNPTFNDPAMSEHLITEVVFLWNFSAIPECFVGIAIIYILLAMSLITTNTLGLKIQVPLSNCISMILMTTCFIIRNEVLFNPTAGYCSLNIATDLFAFTTKITVCFFSSIYFIINANILKEQKLTAFEYLLILLFAILGLMLMCSSNDLLTAYLAIELSSLAFYILAAFKKTSTYSVESGLTYFITGAVSSAFFLLGSSFLYGITGSIDFNDFSLLGEELLRNLNI